MGIKTWWKARKGPGRGYLEDPQDYRDFAFARMSLAAPGKATGASLISYCPPVYDQGRTGTCVAQAFAGALQTRERYHGLLSHTPSRLFMYAHARATHDGLRRDKGTYLRQCARTLASLGAPDEQYWPFSEEPVIINRRPSFQSSMHAHPRMGGRYYRLFEEGSERSYAIRSAIRAGYPVAFGTTISRSFMANDGHRVIERPDLVNDPAAGGHAMLIVGYDQGLFHVRNSWGEDWREGGYAWFTRDYIESEMTRDLWTIAGWAMDRS